MATSTKWDAHSWQHSVGEGRDGARGLPEVVYLGYTFNCFSHHVEIYENLQLKVFKNKIAPLWSPELFKLIDLPAEAIRFDFRLMAAENFQIVIKSLYGPFWIANNVISIHKIVTLPIFRLHPVFKTTQSSNNNYRRHPALIEIRSVQFYYIVSKAFCKTSLTSSPAELFLLLQTYVDGEFSNCKNLASS